MSSSDDVSAWAVLQHIWRLNHAMARTSKVLAVRGGLTTQQRTFLRYIGRFPGVTPSQMCEQLHLDAATVSLALQRLEGRGWIERRRSSRDKRRVTVGLTAAGRKLDLSVVDGLEQAIETGLHRLSPRDVKTTLAALSALADAVGGPGNI
ncbi:MAG: winged helix-turn-helix transcriptional regulator [Archangium sp.]|nr:winged helix-turn-helix transcriptional regulator [Archangium sp.]